MKEYFHGTKTPNISVLFAQSQLHGSEKKVVYLTDQIPYALLYIWDAKKMGTSDKHVTAWVKNGVTFYEEQFPNQLQTFYQGVSGFLCSVQDDSVRLVDGRNNMFFCEGDVPVVKSKQIFDVYEELLVHEKNGDFVVLRFSEQSKKRQGELVEMIASDIKRKNFYSHNPEKQKFMQKYFKIAWQKAFGQ